MSRRQAGIGAIVAGAFVAAVCAAAAAEAPKTKLPAPHPAAKPADAKAPALESVLRYLPKVRVMTTYSLGARFEIGTKDVTFEAPEAYKQGFDFWSGRMKGQTRSEVYEMTTMTQDANDSGLVPFRRTIPKFDLEIHRQGEILASPPETGKSVATLVFEGTFDHYGNVKEFRKTTGSDDAEIETLAIPEISRLFPETDGPHDYKIGEGFKEERVVRLPTKLGIAGLENITYKVTREYTLKSIQGGLATFDVKVTYADDPAFKPGAEKTSLHITGGGSGTAVFEIDRGVFQQSRLPSSMRIDIEAPLRPLPNHPETEQGATGKSHIDLDLLVSGQQTVRRLWGDDAD
jgi:hypothetical protein